MAKEVIAVIFKAERWHIRQVFVKIVLANTNVVSWLIDVGK